MKSSDDIFRLIQSLTKNEKRYFKLSVSKYTTAGDSNYLKLFDAIDAQSEYDEEKLKKKFGKEKIAKNFPTEKNHLYRLILKTLRSYSPDILVQNKVKDLIREAEFLYDKALYDQCGKILGKAKELAEMHELFFALLEIYEMETQLLLIEEDGTRLNNHLTSGFEQARNMFEKASNVFEYRVNHIKAFSLSRLKGDDFRNAAMVAELKQIIEQPIYKDERRALSFDAKHYFYFLHGVYARVTRDHEQHYFFAKKDLELHEHHPEIALEKQHQYVSAISNFSLSQLEKNEYDECLATLEKLKAIPPESSSIRLKIDSVYYARVLAVLEYSGRFEKIDEHIGEAKKFLSKHKGQFNKSKEMNFYWNIAYCYFGTGNYREAVHWINRLLNDTTLEEVRPDMNCHARIFNLILHYEIGNYDLVEYLVRSAGRYINKKNQLFLLEETIIAFLKKAIELHEEKEKKAAFGKLKQQLRNILVSDRKDDYSDYFDFFSWIESKEDGVSFAQKVKEKARAAHGKFGLPDHLAMEVK